MLQRITDKLKTIHKSYLPKGLEKNRRKKILFYIGFYTIVSSVFLTVFGQLPTFASRNLTQVFQIGWVLALIPLIILDYKKVLRSLGLLLCVILPFVLYCLIALIFNVQSFSYSGTKLFFLVCYIFLIGSVFGKYKNRSCIKTICGAFYIAAIIYAVVVFFTKLKGNDPSNQIYVFGDKNSAGPIFMSAAVLSFYVFSSKKPLSIIIRWGSFAFFLLIILLSKTRAILVVTPIILLMLLYYELKNTKIFLIICGALFVVTILLFAIPYLYQNIIVLFIFNSKNTIDQITSGRLTQIVVNLQQLKPFLGSGGSYFDCMPLSLLCSYGIIGLLLLLPTLILPYFVIFKFKRHGNNHKLRTILFILGIMFLVESLFEGFGYFGTGAKVFILWLLAGLNFDETIASSKLNKVSRVPLSAGSRLSKTPKIAVTYSIQSILVVASLFLCAATPLTSNIGALIVDKLPSTNAIADYVEANDIQIVNPVGSMCVGQRITFGVSSDPIDAEDKTVKWGTGWIQNPTISVNQITGEVTADRSGNALLHINRFHTSNGAYIQFGIKEVDEYIFDKLSISTKEYYHSFAHTENESITLGVNCTSHIYYDNFYLPDSSLLTYVSSNPDVAIVEDNIIKALSFGTTEIFATITNAKGITTSVNKIDVSVADETFNPVTSIGLDLPNDIYQHQQYNINPIFNADASDTNYRLEITGIDYFLNNNRLTFNGAGHATITIFSLSDPSVYKEYEYDVLENTPIGFECQTDTIKIGETKNAEELGLYLVFSNGYKKIVTEDDIVIITNYSDYFKNRAWSNQNGLTGDNCWTKIKAVKKGAITLTYTSKIDESKTNTFIITCSAYSTKEITELSRGIGLIIVDLIAIAALVFSLFIRFTQKWLIHVLLGAFTASFILIVFIIYSINVFTIISAVIVALTWITMAILQMALKHRIPLPLLEDPIENIDPEIIINEGEYFQLIKI